jgi:putative ABC transport system substrate-binding protein
MKRREFITLLGGAAVAWPLVVRAQQRERVRHIGVLMGFTEGDAGWQVNVAALRAGLQELGWVDGRNVRIDYRWPAGDRDRLRRYSAEIVALAPDVIFACPHFAVTALLEQTRDIPIVAVQSGDLVEAGFAQTHARLGGNVTGFTMFEATINTKYLQLLKDIAPQVARVCVMQSENSAWRGDFRAIEAVAQALSVEPIAAIVHDAAEIERAIETLVSKPGSGLIIPPDSLTVRHGELITLGGKWLELLKEIAPRVARVAVLFNPTVAATFAEYYLNPIKVAAASIGVEAIAAPVHDTSELESVVAGQAREPNSGIVVIPDAFTSVHRAEVTSLAARYRLPAIYPYRQFAELGGLLSYGFDRLDNWRRAPGYVDRILKGEKPGDLPVQAPTQYELVINLKTAKALGLDVPWILQQRADEVIE